MKQEAQKQLEEEKREIAISGIKRKLSLIEWKQKEIKDLNKQIELIEKGELVGNEDQSSSASFTCTKVEGI